MDGYVVLPTYNGNPGILGLSQNIFKYIANQSIKSFKEIIKKKELNIVMVSIRNDVVIYRMTINVRKGINKEAIKEALISDIKNRISSMADEIPSEFHVKIIEI